MFKFNKTYFLFFTLTLIIEILIALFVHDAFVRPYMGDVLAVILIFCFIKSFLNTKVLPTAIFVLLVAFSIETLQHFNIVEKLKIESKVLRTVLGTSFEWTDFLTYIAGFIIILFLEKTRKKNQ